MGTDVNGMLNRLQGELENALLSLSKSIGAVPPESQESAQLHDILTRLSSICHDVEDLREGQSQTPPLSTGYDVLYLKDLRGISLRDPTKQMIDLILFSGVDEIYEICKRHNIVATPETTHLFVDKEPYTLAEPAKPIPGTDGTTYYVYCCLSVEQKQQRLDEIAKWL